MQHLSVLVIHNRYQQPGGEDAVVRAEVELLRSVGHKVVQYTRDNSEIATYSPLERASLAFSTSWNRESYADLGALILKERPEIAHCHNFLPLISPAAYYACRSAGVPVVQSLHNYRLFCPAGTLFNDGKRREQCLWSMTHGAFSRCYRNSRLQTATVSLMLAAHRIRGTWSNCVDAYIAPSRFCRDYFITAGLPKDKVHLKSNFLARDPGVRTGEGDYALFVGRFSAEKGVLETIEAWRDIPDIPLVLVGDGPLYHEAQRLAESCGGHITLLGQLCPEETLARMKGARFLVFPSRWYEPFGMSLLEAAACAVPAVASRIGAIPELVVHRRTGLLFDPDNFNELVEQVRWAWTHPSEMEDMGSAARQLYLQQFTAEHNYESLTNIYRTLVARASATDRKAAIV